MDPLFDKEATNIYMAGSTAEEQAKLVQWLGDEWLYPPDGERKANIIVYEKPDGSLVVHRLSKIDFDASGKRLWYFKGDNNLVQDNPVYDEAIKYVLVGMGY